LFFLPSQPLLYRIGYKDLEETPWLFLILYGMTFFFTNAGANTTTFILPSELFPTRYRASLHGICAASGKLGAAVGAYAISLLVNQPTTIFYVCTGIAWLGFLLTYFTIPETRGKSLAEMDEQEEERAALYRAENSSH
jgi:PHS family inorganic phosphate transporter-like MFS transporter